jgi:hypothetical protein
MAKTLRFPCDDGAVEATFDTYKGGWLVSFPFGDRRFFGNQRELRAFVQKELKEGVTTDGE